MLDKRREEMRVQIEDVFEKSKQRYGAKKICAALLEQKGIATSQRYVANLMREMGLSCASHNAKKVHQKNGFDQKTRKSSAKTIQCSGAKLSMG